MRSVHCHAHFTHDELAQRMSLLMINEAARCVEEEVASTGDIDLAMVLGTGFAPFHGGPLRYADMLGIANVVAAMEKLAALHPHFAPCSQLKEMAASNQIFFPPKGVNA